MFSIKSIKNVFSAPSSYRSARSRCPASTASSAVTAINHEAARALGVFAGSEASSTGTTINRKAAKAMVSYTRRYSSLKASDLQRLPSDSANSVGKVNSWLSRSSLSRQNADTAQTRLVASVLKLGSWAGNLELVAMARTLGVTLRIVKKDHEATRFGDAHCGELLATINEGGGRDVFVAYDGAHYDALANARLHSDGLVSGSLAPMPGDGDCAYHAVATGAVFSAAALPGLMATEQLNIRMCNSVWQGVFAGENISQSDAYRVMRQAYALQLRYDTAKELKNAMYAQPAMMQELAGV